MTTWFMRLDPKEHTEKCILQVSRYQEDLAKFVAKYPNYCKKCGGVGWLNGYEDVAGDGGSWMPTSDPCDCIEQAKCPLCGRETLELDDLESIYCLSEDCDYNDQNPMMPCAPQEPECFCWETNFSFERR